MAFAQQTPREIIIERLELSQMDALAEGAPITTGPSEEKSQDVPLPPNPPSLPSTVEADDMLSGEIVQGDAIDLGEDLGAMEDLSERTTQQLTLDRVEREQPIKKIKTPKTNTPTKPAEISTPFYVSASNYLDMRGDDAGPQLVLEYRVDVETFGEKAPLRTRHVKLMIGHDYGATQSGQTTKIYDFKLDRLLTLTPYYLPDGKKSDSSQFDNVSLYAKAYRDISAVRGATGGGTKKKVQIGRNKFIDKFWVESAMSWAASPPEMALVVDEDVDSLSISRDKLEVFTAEFDEETYSSATIKDSFLVFAHHEYSIHPLVLKRLALFDSPIKYMEITVFGPSAPNGQKQIWTLTNREEIKGGFPLPKTALSISQRDPVSPLVFVINEAAHGRALDGKKSTADLKAEFNQRFEGGDEIRAWFIGQEYLAHTGIDCEQANKNPVCKDMLAYESADVGERPHALQRYFVAARLARDISVESRIKLIKTVKPNLDDKSAPAFIYRLAAMARAKLTKEQAADAELTNVSAEALLKFSLVKDPYDPNTYVGLAQVLAAKGAFEQSWDVYDALRAGFPNKGDLSMKIDRVEKNLRATAPGFFMPE